MLNRGWRPRAEGHARRLGGGARAAVLGLPRKENRGLDVTPRPGADLGVTKSVCCVFKIASKRLASYAQLNPAPRRLSQLQLPLQSAKQTRQGCARGSARRAPVRPWARPSTPGVGSRRGRLGLPLAGTALCGIAFRRRICEGGMLVARSGSRGGPLKGAPCGRDDLVLEAACMDKSTKCRARRSESWRGAHLFFNDYVTC